MTIHLESPPAVLSAPLEQHARTYIAARRMTGVKLLEAIAALSAARDAAQHGEWGLFLEAVGLDESRAALPPGAYWTQDAAGAWYVARVAVMVRRMRG